MYYQKELMLDKNLSCETVESSCKFAVLKIYIIGMKLMHGGTFFGNWDSYQSALSFKRFFEIQETMPKIKNLQFMKLFFRFWLLRY